MYHLVTDASKNIDFFIYNFIILMDLAATSCRYFYEKNGHIQNIFPQNKLISVPGA